MSTPTSKSAGSASSAIAYPCFYNSQPEEYGYAITQVSGPTTVTIAAQPPSNIPTTKVTVSVSFKNGTAVSGAYVSANAVGTYIYWGDYANLTMYAQTGNDGVAHLLVPAVPLVLSTSYDVQVNLPKSQTTEQVNVGGQLVNVTIYYSPEYVYLSASGLLLPPQTSLSMVLTAQTQPTPILYAQGASAAGGAPTVGAVISSPAQGATSSLEAGQAAGNSAASTTSNAQSTTTSIPPFPASSSQPSTSNLSTSSSSTTSSSGAGLLEIGTIALAAAVAAVVGIAISRKRP